MRLTYFISDLHLSETRPELTALFTDFIQNHAIHAEKLYILGDLFDFWIGDDEDSTLIRQVKTLLQALMQHKIDCYLIRGNRDFLIGKRFAQETGIKLLADYQKIDLYGTPTLLCHGDTLCTDDVKYQQFRQKVHQKWRQWLFLKLPLKVRLKIAEKIRAQSNQSKKSKNIRVMDVNLAFTTQICHQFNVQRLIHGHTHLEGIHQYADYQRIVLGDWKTNYASILVAKENGQIGFLNSLSK